MGKPEKDYLTAGEAAARLCISPKTLARHRAEGKLTAIRKIRTLGGHWRYSPADIAALVAELAKPVKEAS